MGEGITWAVLDTGISREHAHFKFEDYDNLDTAVAHRDFTEENTGPLVDENGHGTHVAGILAGMQKAAKGKKLVAIEVHRDENDDVKPMKVELEQISGVAPKCKLVSLKVLNAKGKGKVRYMLRALAYVQEMNGNGVRLQIHGINMSLGHRFEPEWFACGQSPLCVEIDRLVKSGVVVVVAAGNTGYGFFESSTAAASSVGMDVTINDPGNARPRHHSRFDPSLHAPYLRRFVLFLERTNGRRKAETRPCRARGKNRVVRNWPTQERWRPQ